MATKYKGKDLMLAVEQMDCEKLLNFAIKNKSTKCDMSFKMMIEDMSYEEIQTMFDQLNIAVEEKMKMLLLSEDENKSINKQHRTELIRLLNAIMDIGIAYLEIYKHVRCKPLIAIMCFLNTKMLHLPSTLENLTNKISLLCEMMFELQSLYQDSLLCNALFYIMKRSLQPNTAKREVKRLFVFRAHVARIMATDTVEAVKMMKFMKDAAVNSKFIDTPEGQKIIRIILTENVNWIRDFHEAIEDRLSTTTANQAISYGKIYSAAWIHSLKNNKFAIKEKLELTCIQRFILLSVQTKISKLLENSRKLMSQFLSQKKEPCVGKMLYSLYQPILWRYIRSEDGVVRANAAQIFLDVFPLEDPDENIAVTDQELNDQMLMIKELLTDEFQQVRIKAVSGLCVAIMTNWELFTNDILKTFFNIFITECGLDSTSHELRCAVVMGLKCILENPLSYSVMGKVLLKCRYMFHDTHESVRLAFVQLLIRVNKIKSIKYYDIVPMEDLLERLGEDTRLVKYLVCLLKNSYFPNGEGPDCWLPRCMDMIKRNPAASNSFFHHVPSFIGLEKSVQFIRTAVEAMNYYVLSKVKSKKMCNLSTRSSSSSKEKVLPDEALDLDDPFLVAGLFNGICIMWLVSRSLLEKEENKYLLKMIVSKLTKCLGNLSLYYKDTPVWCSVYFLAGQMPSSSIPSLAPLCFDRLKALPEDCPEEEYITLVECLCSQEASSFLDLLNEWLEKGLSDHLQLTPKPKKRKSRRDKHFSEDDPKPYLALRLLERALDMKSSQKPLLLLCPDKLKDTLRLMAPLQRRIEMSVGKEIKDRDFLRRLHFALLNIAGLLNEIEFDTVKYLEGSLEWYQEKMLQPLLPKPTDNTSWRDANQPPKVSADFRELSLEMFQDVCMVISDLTLALELSPKSSKFLKFAISLLPLDGAILLPVCRILSRQIFIGMGSVVLKHTNTLTIVPECFFKIIHQLNSKHFFDSIPPTDVKEIQATLSESLSIMHGLNSEVDELLSSITLCILKAILSQIEPIGDLQKEFDLKKLSFSPLTNLLVGIMFTKPSIAVFFLKQLQKHVSKPEMNIQTWVSFFAIVKTVWESKKSKSVERELLVLMNKMGGVMNAHPLKVLDTNIPQEEPKGKDSKKSFEEHCMFEYKKLKDVMVPKAIN